MIKGKKNDNKTNRTLSATNDPLSIRAWASTKSGGVERLDDAEHLRSISNGAAEVVLCFAGVIRSLRRVKWGLTGTVSLGSTEEKDRFGSDRCRV